MDQYESRIKYELKVVQVKVQTMDCISLCFEDTGMQIGKVIHKLYPAEAIQEAMLTYTHDSTEIFNLLPITRKKQVEKLPFAIQKQIATGMWAELGE